MPESTVLETWRPVVGFEGWYSVSDLGNVRREMPARSAHVGRILKNRVGRRGYCALVLSRHSEHTHVRVHRLVAAAFSRRRVGCGYVNHKNGVKTDNRAENLEWVTKREDSLHAHRVLGRKNGVTLGVKNHMSKLTPDLVRQIRFERATLGTSYPKLAKKYGVLKHSTIMQVVKRVTWKHVL